MSPLEPGRPRKPCIPCKSNGNTISLLRCGTNTSETNKLLSSIACVAGRMRERASGSGSIQLDPSPILSRLRYSRSQQNKSTRARNPASYAGYSSIERTILSC